MYCYWLISYSNGNGFDHVYFLAECNLIRIPHYGFVNLSHTVLNMHSSVGTAHTTSPNTSTCRQGIFSKGTTWYSDVIWSSSCLKSQTTRLFVQRLVPPDNTIPNSTLLVVWEGNSTECALNYPLKGHSLIRKHMTLGTPSRLNDPWFWD